jgi:hypothetical protein
VSTVLRLACVHQLLVVGAGDDTVVWNADLPRFATLAGSLLTVSSARSDAGSYDLTLRASAGTQSATGVVSGLTGTQERVLQQSRAAHQLFEVPLDRLAAGGKYQFAIRISDQRGSVATFANAPDGWVHLRDWMFSVR